MFMLQVVRLQYGIEILQKTLQGFAIAYFLPFQTEKRKAWTVNRELDKLVVNLISHCHSKDNAYIAAG